jgi:hypothetical protein
VFSLQERTDHLKQAFSRFKDSHPLNDIDPVFLCALATWQDDDSLVQYREPWVRYLWYSQMGAYQLFHPNDPNPFPVSSQPSIAVFSPEGFAFEVIDGIVTYPMDGMIDVDAAPGSLYSPRTCPFPADVPLCADFKPERSGSPIKGLPTQSNPGIRSAFVLYEERKDAYQKWLKQNPRLAELWKQPAGILTVKESSDRMRELPDRTFRKIIHREWITEGDLTAGARSAP